MSPLDNKLRDWHQRATRYRQLSALLGEDETARRLHTLALEMEHRLHAFGRAAATAEERMLDNAILLAQIDTFLARARGAMFFASQLRRPLGLNTDDLREESRLCREEAQDSEVRGDGGTTFADLCDRLERLAARGIAICDGVADRLDAAL